MKKGFVFLIVGRQGSGKSPYVKEFAQSFKNKIVFDPNNEYDQNEFTVFTNFDLFKKYLSKTTDSVIIFEEATGKINAFKDMELSDLSIRVEHNRNALCFLFHSLLDVPKYYVRHARFTYILPTNDDLEEVRTERKFYYPYLVQLRTDKSIIWDKDSYKKGLLIDRNNLNTFTLNQEEIVENE